MSNHIQQKIMEVISNNSYPNLSSLSRQKGFQYRGLFQDQMIFKPGIWLAGGTAASQSEAILENPC